MLDTRVRVGLMLRRFMLASLLLVGETVAGDEFSPDCQDEQRAADLAYQMRHARGDEEGYELASARLTRCLEVRETQRATPAYRRIVLSGALCAVTRNRDQRAIKWVRQRLARHGLKALPCRGTVNAVSLCLLISPDSETDCTDGSVRPYASDAGELLDEIPFALRMPPGT